MGKLETEEVIDEIENVRMSLGTHLEELRRRVVYSVIAIALCFVACWFLRYRYWIWQKNPHKFAMTKAGLSTELQVLSYQEGFYAYMKLCFITSVFLPIQSSFTRYGNL